jgi:hypothetical protein
MTIGVGAEMTCDEVSELAGLYVLDALEAAEHALVRAHLASCAQAHAEIAELGGVVPALAALIEPMPAPGALKTRVFAALTPAPVPLPFPERTATETRDLPPRYVDFGQPRFRRVVSWSAALAAVLVIAVLGAWSMVLQSRANQAEQRTAVIADAIRVMTQPGSSVALLHGTGEAAAATGIAPFPAEGSRYVVLVGLPPAPDGKTYQAWYLADGHPSSAGLVTVGLDGYAVLTGVPRLPGADQFALTIEVAGGALQPSSAPIVAGELTG